MSLAAYLAKTPSADERETTVHGVPVRYVVEEWDHGDCSYYLTAVQLGAAWVWADGALTDSLRAHLEAGLRAAVRADAKAEESGVEP